MFLWVPLGSNCLCHGTEFLGKIFFHYQLCVCSLAVLDLRDGHTGSPTHVLMLSIQAVCGLPRLRAPGIVPCIISFSRQLPCFLMVSP